MIRYDAYYVTWHVCVQHLEQRSHIPDLSKKYSNLFQESYMGHSTHIEQVLIPGTYKAFADAFEQGDVQAAKGT